MVFNQPIECFQPIECLKLFLSIVLSEGINVALVQDFSLWSERRLSFKKSFLREATRLYEQELNPCTDA